METTDMSPTEPPVPICKRCKESPVSVKMRSEMVCSTCFTHFIAGKTIKRMEVLNRETKPPWSETRTMLLALSFGPSSSAMVHVLYQNSERHEKKKRKGGVIEYAIVHIDTSLSPIQSDVEDLLEKYKARFPAFPISIIPLKDIFKLGNIDWSSLPPLNPDLRSEPEKQLGDMFARLPSTTSKTDILRLFVRHLLIAEAVERKCSALLLGHTTTALAEVTLCEAAKGRGFAVPWLVADGNIPVPNVSSKIADATDLAVKPETPTHISLPIYYPMRDVFRKEVLIYNRSTCPPLVDLVSDEARAAGNTAAVVSHKNISIEDVMARYFEDVEEDFPSIVANVARTSAKLSRLGMDDDGNGATCGLCGLGLDEVGDKRWRGEIGDQRGPGMETSKPLCYGCERSIRG